jgi:insertion element IS1 protein InsB
MHACPQCQSDRLANNGSVAGKPKKLCKRCGFQFTRITPRGKPLTTQINAVLFYLSGISMNRIAFLLLVSAQSVLNWIRTFAKAHEEKPEPTGKTIVQELDELWHDLQKKGQKLWIWKALDRDTGQLGDRLATGQKTTLTLLKPSVTHPLARLSGRRVFWLSSSCMRDKYVPKMCAMVGW